ncbi:MAG: hypothetical protein OXG77_05870 [Chloroflexi bacterium]|nr:hypothetical protein [Chloroflexota bacterium]
MRIDPAQFRPEAISPEMSAFNSRLKDLMAQEAGQEITPAYLRRRRREGSPWQSPQRRLEVGIDESCPGRPARSRCGFLYPIAATPYTFIFTAADGYSAAPT